MVDQVSVPANVTPRAPSPEASKVAADVTVAPLAGGKVTGIQVNETAPAGGDSRPAWLPEKFKTPEDLASAYRALEQRLGAASHLPAPAAPAQPAPAQGAQPAPGEQPAQPAPAGGDIASELMQEWVRTGNVSPESRKRFTEKTGLQPTFIDNQIAYMQQQNAAASRMASERLGGEGAVSELMDWAKGRLTDGDRAAFNRAVYSGDPALAQMAVDGLAARYEAEVGRSPRLMAGRKPRPHTGIVPFQSAAEWQAQIRDPKYRTDPAFRAQVEDRLKASMELGIL